MQLTKENIGELQEQLVAVRERGKEYFAKADPEKVVETAPPFCESWEIKDAQTLQESVALRQAIKDLSVDIAAAAQLSPLLAGADMQELRHNTRQMLANVHFNEYRHTGVYVHHDEGTVLGVDPPTHEEIPFGDALTAPRRFDQAAAKTLDLLGLLLPSDAPVKEEGGPAWARCPATSSTAASVTSEIATVVPGSYPRLAEVDRRSRHYGLPFRGFDDRIGELSKDKRLVQRRLSPGGSHRRRQNESGSGCPRPQ